MTAPLGVLSLQFLVKVFKFKAIFYKLRTTNYKLKGALHDGRTLHAAAPTNYSPFNSKAVLIRPLNNGWALVGRDLNSGWNWQPTNQG